VALPICKGCLRMKGGTECAGGCTGWQLPKTLFVRIEEAPPAWRKTAKPNRPGAVRWGVDRRGRLRPMAIVGA
jgi:hypothetical protein